MKWFESNRNTFTAQIGGNNLHFFININLTISSQNTRIALILNLRSILIFDIKMYIDIFFNIINCLTILLLSIHHRLYIRIPINERFYDYKIINYFYSLWDPLIGSWGEWVSVMQYGVKFVPRYVCWGGRLHPVVDRQ